MISIAENLTAAHSRVSEAIAQRDGGVILHLAQSAAKAGAHYLDINLGPSRREAAERLAFVLETLQGHWDRGIWIDSVDAEMMEQAAQRWPGPVVLNGYAGGGAREGVLDVAARHGSELVVFLMDRSVPAGVDERLALAAELVGRCAQKGIGPERIIIDPVLAPMGWMDGQARNAELLTVLRELPTLFGPEIRSVVGLSNLMTRSTGGASFSEQAMRRVETLFLTAAAGAGLTHVMLDVRRADLMQLIAALDALAGTVAFGADLFEGG